MVIIALIACGLCFGAGFLVGFLVCAKLDSGRFDEGTKALEESRKLYESAKIYHEEAAQMYAEVRQVSIDWNWR